MTDLTIAELNDLGRWCDDIGMFATDRSINDTENHKGSCVHRTDFCDKTCYNIKLYRMYPNMAKRDDRCETIWKKISSKNANVFKMWLDKKRKPTTRTRFKTRGEAIKDISDVYRVKAICEATPDTLWWLPTRAWRNVMLRSLIEIELMTLPNCAVNASFDPSNTEEEWKTMIDADWNIMFYGDDTQLHDPVYNKRKFLCPKTHKKMSGHCMDCKAGCFSQKTIGRTQIVHLSEH